MRLDEKMHRPVENMEAYIAYTGSDGFIYYYTHILLLYRRP